MSSQHISQIMSVLSKPPGTRPGHETRPVANWLRSKVRYFKEASDEAMYKLVAECGVETKKENEIIILEGDVGDKMYVVLSGIVDIHRLNEADNIESDEEEDESLLPVGQTLFVDRTPLGAMVGRIGLGAIFGEIALIEDCPRTASVVAGGQVQIAIVPRALYANTVQAMVERQYQTKKDFINRTPYFNSCNPRYKKQLLMAFEVHTYDYASEIVVQGEETKSIYYIIHGEVRLSCDPSHHVHQYIHKLNEEDKQLLFSYQSHESIPVSARYFKNLELCLLGPAVNENENTICTFGDTEALLGLDTYAMNATATTKTVLLSLGLRHVDRYIFKRNQPAVVKMRENVVPRFTFWIRRYPSSISFFQYALAKIEESLRGPVPLVIANPRSTRRKNNTRSSALKLPPRGPLIDLYAQGTVFAYIREQYHRREKLNAHTARRNRSTVTAPGSKGKKRDHTRSYVQSATILEEEEAHGMPPGGDTRGSARFDASSNRSEKRKLGSTYSDRLISLESRMHHFMQSCVGGDPSKVGIRVQSLPKYKPDEQKVTPKSGSVIVLRPVSRQVPFTDGGGESMRQIKDMFSDLKLPNNVD